VANQARQGCPGACSGQGAVWPAARTVSLPREVLGLPRPAQRPYPGSGTGIHPFLCVLCGQQCRVALPISVIQIQRPRGCILEYPCVSLVAGQGVQGLFLVRLGEHYRGRALSASLACGEKVGKGPWQNCFGPPNDRKGVRRDHRSPCGGCMGSHFAQLAGRCVRGRCAPAAPGVRQQVAAPRRVLRDRCLYGTQ
jgi:hypothetical protein